MATDRKMFHIYPENVELAKSCASLVRAKPDKGREENLTEVINILVRMAIQIIIKEITPT